MGKPQYQFEDYRPLIWSVQRMCKMSFAPDYHFLDQQSHSFQYHIVVGSSNILVTEYKFIKISTMSNDKGINIAKGILIAINANIKKSCQRNIIWWQGEQFCQRMFTLPLIPNGERSFVDRGSLFWRGVMVFSSMINGENVD